MWDNQNVAWRGTKQLHIEKLGFVQIIPLNWGVSYHFDWPANRSRLPSRTSYRVPIKLIWQAPTRWHHLHKPSFVRYVTITQKTEAMFITRKHHENTVKSNLYFQTEKSKMWPTVAYRPYSLFICNLENTFQILLVKQKKILIAFKWNLERKPLETLYLTFIRPLFKNGDIVWDCAPQHQYLFQNIENLLLDS